MINEAYTAVAQAPLRYYVETNSLARRTPRQATQASTNESTIIRLESAGCAVFRPSATCNVRQRDPPRIAKHASFCNQQVLRERPLRVDPLPIAAESCARRHLWNFFGLVLVRAFCPDRLVFVQHDAQARS